ncbi:MAG: ROK family protein [Christensenellales bacterium]|jgi:glucokinase
MLSIGIDIGGMSVKIGVMDIAGRRILAKESIVTDTALTPEAFMTRCFDKARVMVEGLGRSMDDVRDAGVGLPGCCDDEKGILYKAVNLGWTDMPVKSISQRILGKPVYIENDGNVAAWAEFLTGGCRGVESAVLLTLGTGLGGGVILNKRLHKGSRNYLAGEIGHTTLYPGGITCVCGCTGCAEMYTAATGLILMGRQAMQKDPNGALAEAAGYKRENMTAKIVTDLARAGNAAAVEIWDRYTGDLAMVCMNISYMLDPDVIALGGGVSAAGEFLREMVQKKAEARFFYPHQSIQINLAQLGNDAGIIGAALLGEHPPV